MLKVDVRVTFDKEGNVTNIQRFCKIPRPSCVGCKFKPWCDRIEEAIKEKMNEGVKVNEKNKR